MTMKIADFVDAWNTSGTNLGRLSISPAGKLIIRQFRAPFATIFVMRGPFRAWWTAMGFDIEWRAVDNSGVFEAPRLPSS
jgi:hypothetical protein